jgi:phage protein D
MTDQTRFSSWPTVEVDGAPLPASVEPQLVGVVVDHHLHLPDMFLLRFADEQADELKTARLRIGAKVSISAHGLGEGTPETLIEGEVTGIEADYTDTAAHTLVRGYDGSHRLHRGRRAETYRNEKISDVARTIAGRASLPVGTIDDTGTTLPHISQHNLTDWEFLRAHSRELGYELSVVDGKFNFRRPPRASTAPAAGTGENDRPQQLVLGADLVEFRPRLSSAQQVTEVKVRTWDPATKQALIGSAPAATTHAVVSTTPHALATTFNATGHLAHDRPLGTQAEADAAAHAIAEQIGSSFVEAEGTTLGNAMLRGGTAVSIAGVAPQFAGKYTLTQARHVFDDDGYRTHFVISGAQERSLLGLASVGASNGHASGGGPPIGGMVVAQVTNNDDPDRLGRVKLKFPWLSDSYESDWVRTVQLGAGPNSGAVFIPEVNDEVLCGFEFGDVRRPYVIGGLHNGKDKPSLGEGLVDTGKVKRRGLVSRKGHRFVLFDDDQKSGIALLTSNSKVTISLNETKGAIHIHCEGPLTIDTTSGAISIKSGSDVAVEAKGSLSLKGQAGIKLESGAMVEISGKLIKLN